MFAGRSGLIELALLDTAELELLDSTELDATELFKLELLDFLPPPPPPQAARASIRLPIRPSLNLVLSVPECLVVMDIE
jgi:hypothetical protein